MGCVPGAEAWAGLAGEGWVVEFGGEGGEDIGGTDDAGDAGGDGLGSVGGIACDEAGDAEVGGFFLDATGVGEDEGGLGEVLPEQPVPHGLGDDDVVECLDRGLDLWIRVGGPEEPGVGKCDSGFVELSGEVG